MQKEAILTICERPRNGNGESGNPVNLHHHRNGWSSSRRVGSILSACALVFVGLLCAVGPAQALDPHKQITQYIHESWTSKNGLPENDVHSITQTPDGYLWFSTENGLVRFDGVQFTVLDRSNTPAMTDDYIYLLAVDREKNLWMNTPSSLFRWKEGVLTKVTAQDGLPGSDPTDIMTDSDGTLWVATSAGAASWNHGKFTVAPSLPHQFRQMLRDRQGNTWLATHEGLSLIKNGRITTYTTKDGLSDNHVNALWEDREGILWIGTNSGLNRRIGGTITKYPLEGKFPHPVINCMRQDSDGNLWIGTMIGLFRINSSGVTSYSTATGLTHDTVRSVFEDRQGNLWVGTTGGINEFRNGIFTPYGKPEGLSDNFVWTVMEGRDGSIWIGTDTGGLNRLKDGKVTVYSASRGFHENMALALREASDGTIWIGKQTGVARFKNGKISPAFPGSETQHPRAILEDDSGSLWFGTSNEGLFQVRKDGSFRSYKVQDGLAHNLVDDVIRSRDGGIWVATDGGLSHFKDGKFRNYTAKDGLSSGYMNALYEDESGTVWIGTSNGLNRFKSGRSTVYTEKDGLPDNKIWVMLEDNHGYMWMSSNKGVFRILKEELNDFAEGKIKSVNANLYGTDDGMRNAEASGSDQPAGWKDHRGHLWFATEAGAVEVDPDHVTPTATPLQVYLEKVFVDKRAVDPVNGGRLPPGGHALEFHYTAPDFSTPQKIHFQYKLEGFDEQWVDAGTRRAAYYTNLAPGRYRFRVKAASADGSWTDHDAAVAFSLQPHFYQTRWFYGLCALGVLGVAISGHRVRIRSLRVRQKKLEMTVDERTKELRQEVIERKRAEEKAEGANQAKSLFLATMSHEIRTPMNGILGMTELVLETPLSPEVRSDLNMVKASADSLLTVINDVLDFSKIEAGKLDLENIPFDLQQTLGEAMKPLAFRAHLKGLELVFEPNPRVPAAVMGDPVRLRQVLMNLVGNAIKFTDQGEILVRVEMEEEIKHAGNALCLHFSVSDTGIGVPLDKQQSIFESFTQVDSSTTRKYGGTGLGLAICKRLVQMMGGNIWVENRAGEPGSIFHFTVRVGVAQQSLLPSAPADMAALREVPVLVVDDNATNRHILVEMVSRWGMKPVAVDSGRLALQALDEGRQSDKPFGLVLLDVHMPEMDGFTVAEHIRQSSHLRQVKIIILTSGGSSGDSARSRELGVSAFLTKPILQAELLESVRTVLAPAQRQRKRQPQAASPAQSGSSAGRFRPLHILLVEDNLVNQALAVRLIQKQGHNVEVANHGREALAMVENSRFDLILMDIEMPEMDGFSATRAIREKEKTNGNHVPIIAMTAHAMSGDEERCLTGGMDGYVSKPIQPHRLFEVIEGLAVETKSAHKIH
jgi:signal transduction histidine kinase/CheY-like chemotaxis protein/ligand-binding sensor domain-containing protein